MKYIEEQKRLDKQCPLYKPGQLHWLGSLLDSWVEQSGTPISL